MASQSKYLNHMLSNWIPKIFCFLLSLFIVLAIRFLNVGDRIVTIPLSVTLPSDYQAVSLIPDTVQVAIKGNDQIIYVVEPSDIHASADFSNVSENGITRVPVLLDYNGDIFRENGLVIEAKPSSVRIMFEAVSK